MISSIKETCLYVKDVAVSKAFYHGHLGFSVIGSVPDRHVFFRVGQSVLLCFNPEVTRAEKQLPPHYASGLQHIAFEVPKSDYAKEKARLLEAGITITHEQDWPNGLESFYFNDPDGHVLEIVPQGLWG